MLPLPASLCPSEFHFKCHGIHAACLSALLRRNPSAQSTAHHSSSTPSCTVIGFDLLYCILLRPRLWLTCLCFPSSTNHGNPFKKTTLELSPSQCRLHRPPHRPHLTAPSSLDSQTSSKLSRLQWKQTCGENTKTERTSAFPSFSSFPAAAPLYSVTFLL